MTVERKTPTAARTSPISSGCWWPRGFCARFFFRTRDGVRGFNRRFLRRRGTAARHSTASCRSPACRIGLRDQVDLRLLGCERGGPRYHWFGAEWNDVSPLVFGPDRSRSRVRGAEHHPEADPEASDLAARARHAGDRLVLRLAGDALAHRSDRPEVLDPRLLDLRLGYGHRLGREPRSRCGVPAAPRPSLARCS